MDRYYADHFSWNPGEGKPSWRSYNFRLDPNLVDQLNAAVARIDAAKWRLKLRYNPRLDADDMRPFIMGSDKPGPEQDAMPRNPDPNGCLSEWRCRLL